MPLLLDKTFIAAYREIISDTDTKDEAYLNMLILNQEQGILRMCLSVLSLTFPTEFGELLK